MRRVESSPIPLETRIVRTIKSVVWVVLSTVIVLPSRQVGGKKQLIVPPPMRVVGYLASWAVRGKGVSIAGLPAKHLTHIFYAFAQIARMARWRLAIAAWMSERAARRHRCRH